MLVIRSADYVTVPWKNGGGITREIFREPGGRGAFDWRLSLATIAASGPFSEFAGYDRTLVFVNGDGVQIAFAGHGDTRLTQAGQLVNFAGEWATSCTLIGGPSTDLNLMVNR